MQRENRSRSANGVYKGQITPHWLPQDAGFWYRNDLPGGASEYVLVDTGTGQRGPLFDHARLAEGLAKTKIGETTPHKLPISALEYNREAGWIEFRAGNADWHCDLKTYELRPIEQRAPRQTSGLLPVDPQAAPRASVRTGGDSSLNFVN
ncbi:MAG: hypothetical protein JSS02_01795, partial [Planctomycetes bacterium]|nr:hypothetical protein [Planctomycetota bacterium]